MKLTLRILLLVLLSASTLGSQALAQRLITGTVSDQDGEPLIGVNVLIAGTAGGTVTDLDGNYSLEASNGDRLIFSYTGYENEEFTVQPGESRIDVTLRSGVQLDEVVVTALGISRERKALGYAVQEVGAEELLESKQPNVVNALQGQVAGVQVTSQGGGPGQAARIIIRGVNSLDPSAENQPLFVVDGMPIDNSTLTVGGGSFRNMSNRVADLNPDDIASISVLKGGAATALYGLRAANGAVIITTKKGKEGRLSVEYTTMAGIEEVNKFPETQKTYTQGYLGQYDPNSFWPSWGPTVEEARQINPDHPQEIFNNYENGFESGSQFRNTLTVTGGNQQATFRASMSRFDHKGVLPFSNYGNTSIRFNGDFTASEKFSFGGGINYINSGGDRVNANRFNESLTYWAPAVDVTDYEFPDGTMKGYRNEGRVGNNPIYGAKTNVFNDNVDRWIGNLRFNYNPFSWLQLNYRFGMDQYTDFRTRHAPAPRGLENENTHEDNGLGYVYETRIRSHDINSNLNARFQKTFDNRLDVSLLVGHDIFVEDYDRVTTSGDELDIWNLFTLNNASIITTDSYKEDYRLIGLYGDLSIGFADMLFLTVTGRNDWTSTLPESSRSFFYPSVSLGYVFTESFLPPDWFSYGKIRASYAEIGKDTQPYRINTVYGRASGFPIGDITGWTRDDQKGANDLLPERTTTLEFGADLRFFRNRLGIDFTWYKSNSKDQIIPVPVSNATGFSTFILNAGEVQNQGIELILRATPVETSSFSWNILVNYSDNKNEVVAIREGIEDITLGSSFGYAGSTASTKLIVGQPYANIYGRSYARYYENPSDDDGITLDTDRPILIGEDGFPVIDTRQRILGNATPKWFGSITNTIRWKGLNFSFMFDARQGVQKYNQMGNFFAAFGIAPYTTNRDQTIVFEGVMADGSANTKEVFLGQGEGPDGVNYGQGFYRNVYRGSTENFVEDANWWRLRNVSLGYTLPAVWLQNLPLSRVNLTLTGTNLWLDTPYSAYDPEGNDGNGNANDGLAGFTYPGVRTFFATLSLGF